MNQLLRSARFSPTAAGEPASREREPEKWAAAGTDSYVRLLARRDDRLVVLRVEEVDWIESAGNYVRLHVGPVEYLLRQTLGVLALQLDARRFVRIHRTTIVNLDSIAELRSTGATGGSLLLHDGRELAVSRRYRRQLFASLGTP